MISVQFLLRLALLFYANVSQFVIHCLNLPRMLPTSSVAQMARLAVSGTSLGSALQMSMHSIIIGNQLFTVQFVFGVSFSLTHSFPLVADVLGGEVGVGVDSRQLDSVGLSDLQDLVVDAQ